LKIAAIYAAMPGCDYGLGRGFKIVNNIFDELGEPIETINLAFSQIPFYDGLPSATAEPVMKTLAEADAVIFAFVSHLDAPCALFKIFLEHFEAVIFSQILRDKNCMLICASKDGGERAAMEYVSMILGRLGAFDAVRVLSSDYAFTPVSGLREEQATELIEKLVEDYYKILRQNRRFIIPQAATGGFNPSAGASPSYNPAEMDETEKKSAMNELYKKYGNFMGEEHEKDISDITKRYVSQYIKTDSGISYAGTAAMNVTPKLAPQKPAAPREKTCRQLTQSLPHHFNPQNAVGMRAVFQISVSGTETFEGYFSIDNSDCEYADGVADNADIVILAEDAAWVDVLKGKSTAQKAFLVGRIKVKGNFALLSKFDILFDKKN
jgi:putative sterol carrier protein